MEMDEINRVARVMVDAEPAPDLAARIRARLDETPTRRAWSGWPIAAGLAAAAVVTFAVLGSWGPEVLRSRGPEVTTVQKSRGPEVQGSSLAVAGGGSTELASPKPTAKAGHSSGARRAQAQSTRALSAEELAWMERRMPALDPVVALQMDRLATESIQPEALAITPLTMTALPTTSAAAERRVDRQIDTPIDR